MSPGPGIGAGVIACTEVTTDKAKPSAAINLIMFLLLSTASSNYPALVARSVDVDQVRTTPNPEPSTAKAEMIRFRIAGKKRELIPMEEAAADFQELIGMFTSGLAGFAARCDGR